MMDINQACEAFKVLLQEQMDRVANMNTQKTDFSTKECVTIGIVDGDGIGPIITQQATRVLEKLLADEIAAGTIVLKQIEGLTIENRMAQGKAIPDDVLAQIKACDVILKGPTETPPRRHAGICQCDHASGAGPVRKHPPRVHSRKEHRLDVLPGKHRRRICSGQPGR